MVGYPLFTYWDDDDASPIEQQVDACKVNFPDYFVLTRDIVRAMLFAWSPEHLKIFDCIAIPACRSDIARLLGLLTGGGLYIDAHCRIDDADEVVRLMAMLHRRDMVISTRYAPNFGQVMPHNSIMWSRANGSTVQRLLDQALENLAQKYSRERIRGFEPYHVWDLTGPGVLWRELFDTTASNGRLLTSYLDQVATVFEVKNPVTRHVFIGYRSPGHHWSERQKSECLFV